MTESGQPRPLALDIGERLAMTSRAVVDGIVHELKGEHETESRANYAVPREQVERVITEWPSAQQNIARQMLAKYGPPNEATPTKLFW